MRGCMRYPRGKETQVAMYNENERTSPWLIAFRVLFTIAVAGCIAFIFSNSLEIGPESSARSQAVMHYINAVLGRIGLGPVSEHAIRKLAHFAEYCLEGLLLTLCLRVYTRRFVRHISWPLLLGLLTAVSDETIQRYVAGRSSQVTDVWIDFAGVVGGMLVSLVLLLLLRAVTSFYSIKKENRRLRQERDELRRRQQPAAARRSGTDTPQPARKPHPGAAPRYAHQPFAGPDYAAQNRCPAGDENTAASRGSYEHSAGNGYSYYEEGEETQ